MEYRKFDLLADAAQIPELVQCYRSVFATAPWREWKQCTVCKEYWGLEDSDKLEAMQHNHCDHPVSDYWPAETVEADLRAELAYPDSSCWVASDGGNIVGFCHGYRISAEKLEHKLELPGLAAAIVDHYGDIDLAYQDEIGVLAELRGHGLANELFRRRNADFEQTGLKVGVVRTMSTPPSVTYLWYTRLGYKTIGQYNDHEGRVVLALPLQDLPVHLRS